MTPWVDSPLFTGIPPATDFYFVHSFHVACSTTDQVLATTPYCDGFVSAAEFTGPASRETHAPPAGCPPRGARSDFL